MKILFYSNKCQHCVRILNYIKQYNLSNEFNMIDVQSGKELPSHIKVVPTIIDTDIAKPLEGKKAFEYISNQKFFGHPTNNITYWKDKNVPKPEIIEDKKARDIYSKKSYRNIKDKNNNLLENKNVTEIKETNEVNPKRKEQNFKLKKLIDQRRKQDNKFNKR